MAENFVLVHGAWHGAWCWASVIGALEREGHRADAVDLPGRRGNPMSHAKITREVWVDSVVRFIEQSNLRNVVLAGHSYGGLTITGVALRIPQRLKRLIYVTAVVPPEDRSLLDDWAAFMSPETAAAMQQIEGGISSLMELEHFRRAFIQDASRDLQDFVYSALAPEAMGPAGEVTPMKEFHVLGLPTSYVACEDDLVFSDPRVWHPGFSGRLRNPTIRSIKSGHEVMFTRPLECARALVDLARG
jgi:pimeloyl-ACP methyl ester carboxylesterase